MRRVLWTLVPIGSLGLLGWVPPLRIALRRRTPGAWLWFAGSAGAAALVIVLVSTMSGPDHSPPGWVGGIEVANIVFAAVYTGIATKALTPRPRPTRFPPHPGNGYGYGRNYGYGYNQGPYAGPPQSYPPTPPVSAPPVSTPPADVPTLVAPTLVVPQAPAPSAAQAAAAEVQAELRELRDLLGESAAGRSGEQPAREQW